MVSGNQLKKIFLLTTLTLCVGMMSAIPAGAQKKERQIAGKTYVYDYDKKKVYNKSNSQKQDFVTYGFSVSPNTIVADGLREILGKKRIEELKDDGVIVSFVCRGDGTVESVNCLFPTKSYFTPEEMKRIEERFLAQRFDIRTDPEIKGKRVGFSYHIRFRNL